MCARADRERAANRLVRKPDRKARKITAMLVRLASVRTNFDLNVGHVGIRDSRNAGNENRKNRTESLTGLGQSRAAINPYASRGHLNSVNVAFVPKVGRS